MRFSFSFFLIECKNDFFLEINICIIFLLCRWGQRYLPSEFDLSAASAWAAKALVRSNSNSWNCFDSDCTSPDLQKIKSSNEKGEGMKIMCFFISIYICRLNILFCASSVFLVLGSVQWKWLWFLWHLAIIKWIFFRICFYCGGFTLKYEAFKRHANIQFLFSVRVWCLPHFETCELMHRFRLQMILMLCYRHNGTILGLLFANIEQVQFMIWFDSTCNRLFVLKTHWDVLILDKRNVFTI